MTSMDSVAASRPSTSDPSNPLQGPIPLFDAHLRILSESYLSFFQERIESLLKLHRKIKSFDTYLDNQGELSTTRSAWNEVRDGVEREAQAREAFCATLTTDVISPLTTLKETQDRTRKRIKEDLKESSLAYNEYSDNILPKLKSKYGKKFAEVEEQKRAATVSPTPQMPSPALGSGSEQYHHLSNSRSNPSIPTRPAVTGPQPLRALDRRPSGSGPPPRNRSPSSSTPFSDFAHQGKKQLNQLIGGFLDKGGVKETLGGSRENQALRTVRTKREADEAGAFSLHKNVKLAYNESVDREYRKGIHWLETLRLRRTKILEGGFKYLKHHAQSLEMFVEELSLTMKKALERYTDNMTATFMTQSQLSTHASLLDYATAKGLQDGEVPKIVRICIREIDRRGLESEGIYRVSGRHAVVQSLQHNMEKDEERFEFSHKDDIYAVSSLLKLYLRELPEPVFRFPLQERIHHTEERSDHISSNFMLIRSKIRRLPLVHQATLKAILEHLARVATLSEKNKMDPKNLAIVFGSVIFGEDEMPKGGDLLSVQSWKDSVMEDLIIYAHVLYEEHPSHHSPPLPPTPAGEPVPAFTYGSKNTKVASVPPSTPSNNSSTMPTSSPQDFMPRLPARPASSIHPSSRTNPQTPTRGRLELPLPPLSSRHSHQSPNNSPPHSPSASSFYETDVPPSPDDETPSLQPPTLPNQSVSLDTEAPSIPPHIHPDNPPN
ncbi:hypothetical protein H0H92_011586 [Tricholoma furcatifolium]|nr:hypothetical protein H0H92_011586 [Tricholoma furcatifolium]